MFRLLLTAILPLLVFSSSLATSLFKPDIFTNNWRELPVVEINYENQDEERDTKNEKPPPRIVSFFDQFPTSKRTAYAYTPVIKIFLTGYGKNVVFKTKIDKRLFKMFARMAAFYSYGSEGKAKIKLILKKLNSSPRFEGFYSLYYFLEKQGYSKNTRKVISRMQERFVYLLEGAEYYLEEAKGEGDSTQFQELRREIGFYKGMLKELGRLITHLDKQKQ